MVQKTDSYRSAAAVGAPLGRAVEHAQAISNRLEGSVGRAACGCRQLVRSCRTMPFSQRFPHLSRACLGTSMLARHKVHQNSTKQHLKDLNETLAQEIGVFCTEQRLPRDHVGKDTIRDVGVVLIW